MGPSLCKGMDDNSGNSKLLKWWLSQCKLCKENSLQIKAKKGQGLESWSCGVDAHELKTAYKKKQWVTEASSWKLSRPILQVKFPLYRLISRIFKPKPSEHLSNIWTINELIYAKYPLRRITCVSKWSVNDKNGKQRSIFLCIQRIFQILYIYQSLGTNLLSA